MAPRIARSIASGDGTCSIAMIAAPITPARPPSRLGTTRSSSVASGSERLNVTSRTLDAVYTHDDDMAQGVVQAIRNAGRDDEMFLTGVGGSQDAMDQIKEGGL